MARHSERLIPASLGILLALSSGGVARADLFAFTHHPAPLGSGTVVAHYSDAGQFVQTLPHGATLIAESAAGLTAAPDGWVYYSGNMLGAGYVNGIRPDNPSASRGAGPGPLNYPGGMTLGPDGKVYTASNRIRSEGVTGVLRFDPADGSLTTVVTAREPAVDFAFARAVAVGRDGDIYLSRDGIGVARYAAGTGEFVSLVVPPSVDVLDMDIGPDGNLYLPTAAGVYRYDAHTGARIDPFIPNGRGGLVGVSDLSFGGDGFVYLNDRIGKAVLRYDAVTGAFRDVFIGPEQYATGHLGDLRQIVYVVPEPVVLPLALAALALLVRRR